jgi:hypothetical protein
MKLSEGRFYVPHFQAKVQVDNFIRADEKLWAKTTLLLVGYYGDNFQYPVFAVNKIVSLPTSSLTGPCHSFFFCISFQLCFLRTRY